MKRNYYEVLGLTESATADEIKASYRRLAMKHHPDRNQDNPDAEEKFKEAKEAYEVLSDPEKRSSYDQFGHAGDPADGIGGWEEEVLRRAHASFHQNFNQGPSGLIQQVHVPVDMMILGGKYTCICMVPTVLQSTDRTRTQVHYKRTLKELNIEPNTKTGIVVEEELLGEKIQFVLIAASTDNFIVQGVDIGTQHYLDVIEAMTETHTMIAYPGGKTLKVKIPKGVKQDQVIRAKGKGLTSANGMQGDFMIQYKFSIPEFTKEQRQKLREIFGKTKS